MLTPAEELGLSGLNLESRIRKVFYGLTPEEARERIAEIPTRLVLNSECDRQLLHTAAFKLVEEHRDKILEFLGRR